MRALNRFFTRLLNFATKSRGDERLKEEIESHIAIQTDENIRAGMTPGKARRQAVLKIGAVEAVREQYHAEEGVPFLQNVLQDCRYALRQLRKSPGFTVTAVLILALSIGSVTAVSSILDSVLLRPYNFRDPGQIVVLREIVKEVAKQYPSVPDNYRHFLYVRSHARTIQDAALLQNASFAITTGGAHPRIEKGLNVSPSFFSVLGVTPMLGRTFRAEEAQPGRNGVILISWTAWQDLFRGDPDVVGRTVEIKGEPAMVVGVLPRGFEFPVMNEMRGAASPGQTSPYQVFQPFVAQGDDLTSDDADFAFLVIARLKQGVSANEASIELGGLLSAYSATNHLPIHLSAIAEPLSQEVMGDVGAALWLLFAAVLGLLLIACVNLASLQFARSIMRERDNAVRAALGAGRARLFQAALMESIILSLVGGVAGILLALGGIRAFSSIAPANLPRLNEIHISWTVLLFACGISGLAALLSGTFPALRSLHSDPQRTLQLASARVSRVGQTTLVRRLLIVFEIGCTVALLTVTGLVVRSFSRLLNQPHEFDANHVILAEVDLLSPRYQQSGDVSNSARTDFVEHVLDKIHSTPGVELASITSAMPLSGDAAVHSIYRPDHPLPESEVPNANLRNVSAGYFATMRTRLISGRDFTVGERPNPQSAIISQRAAQAAWPGSTPLDRKMKIDGRVYTVIGIAADARIADLKEDIPVVYLPFWHDPPASVFFLIRTSRNLDEFASTIRRQIWDVDPEVAIPNLEMLDSQMEQSVAPERFLSIVLSSFSVAALLLAVLGVYGVLAYSVSLRTPEFGIRVALGSNKSSLIRLVLREAVGLVAGGIALGLVTSFVATRTIRSLLYDTSPSDPTSIIGSMCLLVIVTLIAALLPAYRASRIDPMKVLRSE